MRKLGCWLIVCLLSIPAVMADDNDDSMLVAIKCGWLIDGLGGEPATGRVIVLKGDRIKEISRQVPDGAEVIDLSDKYVLPGLIDCHTHVTVLLEEGWQTKWVTDSAALTALKSTRYARQMLDAGFTTCRNVGAGEFVDVALRDAINAGYIIGPRLFVSAHAIGMTGGHCDLNGFRPDVLGSYGSETVQAGRADGGDEIRKAVRYQIKYGADVIKTCATGGVLSTGDAVGATQYSFDELKILVEEAHMADRKVAAHAHGLEGIKRAIRAGVDSIEHGSVLDDEAIALMKQRGTYLVPTRYVGEVVEQLGAAGKLPPGIAKKAHEIAPKMRKSFRKAVEAGVKIAFGTDVGVFAHRDAAKEFSAMVEGGMGKMAAIVAATKNAADLLGQSDDLGTIQAGRFADIIAIDANPLDDITALEHVIFVMKGGQVVKDLRSAAP